ncbi:hypothetical protein OEZ49_12110 [Ruegeria sp. WL0004]|uniref:NADH dehydrogenase n=2 Tax=Ruegeria TaxID=97050 RepID=A0ABT2WWY5_9RHOB|nr:MULTISPECIES: hypothetical protein [unclassified Ruegeria]MCU9838513.1 hypothetical protein [Ruegeria sp. WL0004]MCV2890184.1 hypothetical protein [Ruegeria sp. XHP0148]
MEFLFWLVWTVATIVPMLKLLPHFGIDKYWALVCVVPIGAIALLWWMAVKLQELERR